MTIKVKLLEPIEGYSDIVEYRMVGPKEWYFNTTSGDPTYSTFGHSYSEPFQLVLTPIPKWRPATLEDAIRAIKGETVKARFKDTHDRIWKECELTGYDKVDKYPFRAITTCYEECEVLDV